MKTNINAAIHNKFEFILKNAETGEIKERVTSYNIICNQVYRRMEVAQDWFNVIGVGDGTGALSPTRTSMFHILAYKGVESTVWNIGKTIFDPHSLTRKITLLPSECVDKDISEVSIMYSSTSTNTICTHSLILDSEGNPITIHKTSLDVLEVYATVYCIIQPTEGIKWIDATHNSLLNLCLGSGYGGSLDFFLSPCASDNVAEDSLSAPIDSIKIDYTIKWDVATKRMTISGKRIDISTYNGRFFKGYGLGGMCVCGDIGTTHYQDYVVSLDVDGEIKFKDMPMGIIADSLIVKVNGQPVVTEMMTGNIWQSMNSSNSDIPRLNTRRNDYPNGNINSRPTWTDQITLFGKTFFTSQSPFILSGGYVYKRNANGDFEKFREFPLNALGAVSFDASVVYCDADEQIYRFDGSVYIADGTKAGDLVAQPSGYSGRIAVTSACFHPTLPIFIIGKELLASTAYCRQAIHQYTSDGFMLISNAVNSMRSCNTLFDVGNGTIIIKGILDLSYNTNLKMCVSSDDFQTATIKDIKFKIGTTQYYASAICVDGNKIIVSGYQVNNVTTMPRCVVAEIIDDTNYENLTNVTRYIETTQTLYSDIVKLSSNIYITTQQDSYMILNGTPPHVLCAALFLPDDGGEIQLNNTVVKPMNALKQYESGGIVDAFRCECKIDNRFVQSIKIPGYTEGEVTLDFDVDGCLKTPNKILDTEIVIDFSEGTT